MNEKDLEENPNFMDQLNFLHGCFTRAISFCGTVQMSKVDEFFGKMRDQLETMAFFNFDYMYQIFYVYHMYLKNVHKSASPQMTLALFLQRYAGRGKTFQDSARVARADLLSTFKMPESICNDVYSLIHSSSTIKYFDTTEKELFLHLNLSRLAAPKDVFIRNQELIQKDCPYLTKEEFYKSQNEIYKKLVNRHNIYDNVYFTSKFERIARENIYQYLFFLDKELKSILEKRVEIGLKPKLIGGNTGGLRKFTIQNYPVELLSINSNNNKPVKALESEGSGI